MKKLVNNISKLEFTRSVAKLMGGNISSQLILIGSAPIVTRLFSPEDFGLFALYTAIIAIFSKIGSLCYERAILLPKDHLDAVSIFGLSLAILFALVLLVASILSVFGDLIVALLGNPNLEKWLFLIPLGMLATAGTNIVRFWALRCKQYRLISISRVSEAFFSAASKISLGVLIGNWAGGLFFGALIGNSIALFILSKYSWDTKPPNSSNAFFRHRLKAMAFKYKSFPYFASVNALLNVVSVQLPVFFLSSFFGPAVVGFYNLANRILKQPITTLSESVANVYFRKSASQVADKHKLVPGLAKTVLILFFLGAGPFLFLALFGENIFSFIFGAEWVTAGMYSQILAPWFFILFCTGPTNIVFEVCQKQNIKLLINSTTLLLTIFALATSYSVTKTANAVIITFTVVNIIMSLIQIAISTRIACTHDQNLAL